MNKKHLAPLTAAIVVSGLWTQATSAAVSTEDALKKAQGSVEAGKPMAARTTLAKLLKGLEKQNDKANLARTHELLGQVNEMEERFAEALNEYETAMALAREQALDPAQIQGRLDQLKSKYRPVDFSEIDKDKKLAELTKSAGTLNLESTQKVSIELNRAIKQNSQELMGQNAKGTGEQAFENGTSSPASKNEAQQLKQVRFDKKIGFEVQQENEKVRVKNIEGIFFDVGLWVKLKEVVLSVREDDPKPGLEVTAGKFGVEKTVHVDLPAEALKHIRKGLGILDPFLGIAPAQAATLPPQSAPDSGNQKLESGNQKVESGNQKLDSGDQKLEAGNNKLDDLSPKPVTGSEDTTP